MRPLGEADRRKLSKAAASLGTALERLSTFGPPQGKVSELNKRILPARGSVQRCVALAVLGRLPARNVEEAPVLL